MEEARTVFRQIQQMNLEMIEAPLVEDQNQVVKKSKKPSLHTGGKLLL